MHGFVSITHYVYPQSSIQDSANYCCFPYMIQAFKSLTQIRNWNIQFINSV